jgi:hypothetical protein
MIPSTMQDLNEARRFLEIVAASDTGQTGEAEPINISGLFVMRWPGAVLPTRPTDVPFLRMDGAMTLRLPTRIHAFILDYITTLVFLDALFCPYCCPNYTCET